MVGCKLAVYCSLFATKNYFSETLDLTTHALAMLLVDERGSRMPSTTMSWMRTMNDIATSTDAIKIRACRALLNVYVAAKTS